MTPMHDQLVFVTQDDVTYRRVFDPSHRSYIPNLACYIKVEKKGAFKYYAVTRQMVLFAVERRKAWRMLQSKAGIINKDYLAQKALLARIDRGELTVADAKANLEALLAETVS
jgi:pyruvate-ferredoxin/flavodoxin oxidoreductase